MKTVNKFATTVKGDIKIVLKNPAIAPPKWASWPILSLNLFIE